MSEIRRKSISLLLLACLGLVSAVVLWVGFTVYMMIGDGYKFVMNPVWIAPSQWQILEGEGQVTEQGFEVREVGARSRIVAAARLADPIDAATIEEVEILIQSSEVPQNIEFGWSRSRTLSGFDRHWVTIDTTGRAVVSTRHFFRWDGHIWYVLIVTRGQLPQPLVLHGVALHLARPGFVDLQRQLFGDWFDWRSWTQVSINRALVGDGVPLVSPVLAVAAWGGLLIVLVLLVQPFRTGGRTGSIIAGIFLIGWVSLDLRWQGDLLYKNAETRDLFWGKTWTEKRAADIDGDVFVFMEALKETINDTNQRLLVFAPYEFAHQRARYFAMPMEVHSGSWPPRRITMRRVKKGDKLVMVELPFIEAAAVCEEGLCKSHLQEPLQFELDKVVGRHAAIRENNGGLMLELEEDGVWLVESGWLSPPPMGFYALQASLASAGEAGWVILQVLQQTEAGERTVVAERDFYVTGNGFDDFELPVAIAHDGRILYRFRNLEAEGLQISELKLSPAEAPESLSYIVVAEPATKMVVRPVKASETVKAYEIQ